MIKVRAEKLQDKRRVLFVQKECKGKCKVKKMIQREIEYAKGQVMKVDLRAQAKQLDRVVVEVTSKMVKQQLRFAASAHEQFMILQVKYRIQKCQGPY